MQVIIPLDNMTTEDKLRAIEHIWEDLLRTPEDIPSPAWHVDVLRAREDRARDGSAQLGDWTEAKRRIRRQLRRRSKSLTKRSRI